MAKNNIFLALAVVLLIISMVSTAIVFNAENIQTGIGESPGTGNGEIKFTVLGDPGSDSTTGYIGVKILPDDDA